MTVYVVVLHSKDFTRHVLYAGTDKRTALGISGDAACARSTDRVHFQTWVDGRFVEEGRPYSLRHRAQGGLET